MNKSSPIARKIVTGYTFLERVYGSSARKINFRINQKNSAPKIPVISGAAAQDTKISATVFHMTDLNPFAAILVKKRRNIRRAIVSLNHIML